MTTQHEHGNCQELLSQVSDYVDGELEAALCAEIEAHLADCPDCRVMVDTLRRTISLYHAHPAPDLPTDVQDRLFKVLKLD